MAMQSAFAHLILDVQSLDRSLLFYRDLGFQVRRTDELEGHRLAYLAVQQFEILLLEQPSEDQLPAFQRGGGIVLNLRVPGLSRLAELLKNNAVPVLRDLEEPAFGDKTLLISDPDGYAILLSESVETVH